MLKDEEKETIIVNNLRNILTYTQIIKAIQPIDKNKTFNFSIPEIFIFSQGEIEIFLTQKRKNLYGQYKILKNVPLSKIKTLMPKNGCICKYNDNNVQLLNDNEIALLDYKILIKKIWKDVLYLQSFHFCDFRILYISEQDNNTELFKRANIWINIIIKDIIKQSEQFITDEQEEQFEQSLNQQQLCIYNTYKIINYIEKVRNIKITHGIFKWSLDNDQDKQKEYIQHFIDCTYVNHIIIENIKLIRQPNKNLQLNDVINDDVVNYYTTILTKQYEKKKNDLGMDENQFLITKDKDTEKVFKEIHQGSKISYNQLFKDINSFTQYEGTLIKYLKQRHTVKYIRPRIQTVMLGNNSQSPLKSTTIGFRPKTQQQLQIKQLRTPSYQQYKQKTAQRTLPYLLQF